MKEWWQHPARPVLEGEHRETDFIVRWRVSHALGSYEADFVIYDICSRANKRHITGTGSSPMSARRALFAAAAQVADMGGDMEVITEGLKAAARINEPVPEPAIKRSGVWGHE